MEGYLLYVRIIARLSDCDWLALIISFESKTPTALLMVDNEYFAKYWFLVIAVIVASFFLHDKL